MSTTCGARLHVWPCWVKAGKEDNDVLTVGSVVKTVGGGGHLRVVTSQGHTNHGTDIPFWDILTVGHSVLWTFHS